MTTDEMLRKQVHHTYKIHQMEQDRLKKKSKRGTWNWVKREIFFAEEMTNAEFFSLLFWCAVAIPFVVGITWLVFAVGYAFQGM